MLIQTSGLDLTSVLNDPPANRDAAGQRKGRQCRWSAGQASNTPSTSILLLTSVAGLYHGGSGESVGVHTNPAD
jgi:hypothetical protein